MHVTIKSPIKPGERRAFTITPAHPVTVQPGNVYAKASVIDGDSSAPTINPESTDKKITGFLHGDGSLGEKRVRLHIGAHLGKPNKDGTPGPAAAQDVDITYTVGHPDATTLTFADGSDTPEPPK